MNNKSEKNVYTPVLKATGERITIEKPIFEGNFWSGRGLRRKGIIRDPSTDKRYVITGKACGLPNCQCDAWAVELGEETDASAVSKPN
jgi:hypothetical protein